jgi:hypothetical protein
MREERKEPSGERDRGRLPRVEWRLLALGSIAFYVMATLLLASLLHHLYQVVVIYSIQLALPCL